jgi:hypothetical protein
MLNTHNTTPVHLAFDPHTLEALISEGKLHAADFTCLDAHAKKTVWQVLLANVLKGLKA